MAAGFGILSSCGPVELGWGKDDDDRGGQCVVGEQARRQVNRRRTHFRGIGRLIESQCIWPTQTRPVSRSIPGPDCAFRNRGTKRRQTKEAFLPFSGAIERRRRLRGPRRVHEEGEREVGRERANEAPGAATAVSGPLSCCCPSDACPASVAIRPCWGLGTLISWRTQPKGAPSTTGRLDRSIDGPGSAAGACVAERPHPEVVDLGSSHSCSCLLQQDPGNRTCVGRGV